MQDVVAGVVPQAKVDRFLESHYQDHVSNIDEAFRKEHKFERSGKNIAEYVKKAVSNDFVTSLEEERGQVAAGSIVAHLVEGGSSSASNTPAVAKTVAKPHNSRRERL